MGVTACAARVGGMFWGGITIGDVDRLRKVPARDRLRDRPRIFALRAPKNESSAGVTGERELREYVEVGDSVSGDAVPEDCDFCDPLVAVRMGGGGVNRS